MVLFLLAVFLFWRIDSPRAEHLRAQIVDRIVPAFDWVLVPVTKVAGMVENFQSYTRLFEQNQELRRELQQIAALDGQKEFAVLHLSRPPATRTWQKFCAPDVVVVADSESR